MKTSLVLIALTAGAVASGTAETSCAAKPNIILIYSDDHGWADLGAQGVNLENSCHSRHHPLHETPSSATPYLSSLRSGHRLT